MKKRLLALLCTASLLLTTAALPVQATQSTRPVEMSDVLDILKSLVGIAAPLSLDYDFNQNGVIDTGDALEGLKSLIGAREVVMLPVKTGIVTTPLTAEMDLRLRTDWVNPAWMQPEHYEGRTPDNAEVVMYLGTYHTERFGEAIVVVMDCIYRPNISIIPWRRDFADYWLISVWNNGQFYQLPFAFDRGIISLQHVEELRELANTIEIPDTLRQKVFVLPEETEQRIINDLSGILGWDVGTLHVYIGISNSKIVTIMSYPVGFSHWHLWNDGEIAQLEVALKEGWLTELEMVNFTGLVRAHW